MFKETLDKEKIDAWRICTSLGIFDAASLMAGTYPAAIRNPHGAPYLREETDLDDIFQAYIAAIKNAIRDGSLEAGIKYYPLEQNEYSPRMDWSATIVKASNLTAWLSSRGITSGFFFPSQDDSKPSYLDDKSPHYAPKLAAAIRAWEAVTSDQKLLEGRTPKQALVRWLNLHASHYGLTKDDGTPNATGVEETAKMANWDTAGGAPKTPAS